MFTGIVEELGQVAAREDVPGAGEVAATRLTVRGPLVTADVAPGDSISVNGVCLTVVESSDGCFRADVMRETLVRSSLGGLTGGSPVNLERAVRVSDRLGGHLVQGHVDGTGEVLDVQAQEQWTVLRIALPAALARYVVEKGSITVDGVSLTVSAVRAGDFEVSLIPTTLQRTTLGGAGVGTRVNLEVDITAKYVEKLLQAGVGPAGAAS